MMQFQQGAGTAEVLDLAKGISDYGAVLMLAGVMLANMIWQIIDNIRRQRRYEEQNTGLASMAEFAKKAADYFEERSERKINIDQARAIISTEFNRAAEEVVLEIIKIKEANNLQQTDIVCRKIEEFLDRRYATMESHLRKFEFEGHPLSSFAESGWKERTKQHMLGDCATHEYNVGRLEDVYRNEFSGYRNTLDQKLDDLQYPKT